MHLSEGVLHSSTLLIGAVGAVLGLAIGLKKMTGDKLALTALFSAAFFVASTIHIPVGIGSVHLILNGIAGLFLGWRVFPAFLIALTLQALMFSFGGIGRQSVYYGTTCGGGQTLCIPVAKSKFLSPAAHREWHFIWGNWCWWCRTTGLMRISF